MPRVEIASDVLEFINRRIDSVPHLEALLLFWEMPSTVWTEEEISKRVYVSSDKAKSILQDLARNGFIVAASEVPGGYHYEQRWDEAQLMPRVAASYRKHLVHLSNLIHTKTASEAVQEFARAFNFTQKDKE
jgi:hypothetical protein